jgi:hypothetical protein
MNATAQSTDNTDELLDMRAAIVARNLEVVINQRNALTAALREIADIAPTDSKARGYEYGAIARAALAKWSQA